MSAKNKSERSSDNDRGVENDPDKQEDSQESEQEKREEEIWALFREMEEESDPEKQMIIRERIWELAKHGSNR
ncbi:hypothetical protein O3W44_04815 [Pantoea sp. LMR881]|uniref:hypothetical protein n=1 Tax=Pantoea sp. LMR881 TaxID=3014336 RepID=UPI0022B01571|nr:hypothetical protein [Pantoea sp. LMR881]MCZ4058541.1 hypothetical protein [Pantoea sp. LMR881]